MRVLVYPGICLVELKKTSLSELLAAKLELAWLNNIILKSETELRVTFGDPDVREPGTQFETYPNGPVTPMTQ